MSVDLSTFGGGVGAKYTLSSTELSETLAPKGSQMKVHTQM